MNRVEQHRIDQNHPMYKICDELCFKSKNLYNYANYILRQEFINNKKYIKYNDLTYQLKHSEPFEDLGSNSSQHTLKMLDKSWKSFFVSIKDYSKNPSKYLGKPNLPKYKKKDGRHICILTNWQTQIKNGYLYFAFKPLKPYNDLIKTKIKSKHIQTRIVPKGGCYILEIVYEKEVPDIKQDSKNIIGIDLGLNNFATLTNNIGQKPIIIKGGVLKSINQYYNKKLAHYKSVLKKTNNKDWSNKLNKLTLKKSNKINNYMHKVSKWVIDYCKTFNIDTIVIGNNKEWKQNSKMSKKVNQQFVQLPFESFILKLQYKAENVGINVIVTEESYTSGTSFLDDELPIKENYNKSRRIHRGLFKSDTGKLINSDVNGSFQIIKKVFPNAFSHGIEGVDLYPIVVNI